MKLREISVKNFRCLVDVTVPIDDTTVLVGENLPMKSFRHGVLRLRSIRSHQENENFLKCAALKADPPSND